MNPFYWYLLTSIISALIGAGIMLVFVVHRLGWRLDVMKAEITRINFDGSQHTSKLVFVGNDAYYLKE